MTFTYSDFVYLFNQNTSFIISSLVGIPFDTIKVRLQAMPLHEDRSKRLYSGVLDCLKKTVRQEGYRVSLNWVEPVLSPLRSQGIDSLLAGVDVDHSLKRKTLTRTRVVL